MLKSLKRMLVLIPCMILGLFLCSSIDVSATKANLLTVDEENHTIATKISIGSGGTQNEYYFTNSEEWTLYITDYKWTDKKVEYRVVQPDGTASKLEECEYTNLNNDGKCEFNISSLSYTDKVDVTTRSSVLPEATWYIDVKYYGLFNYDQDKEEVVKVIYNKSQNGEINVPDPKISYDSSAKAYVVNASVLDSEGKGVSLITKGSYLFSDTKLDVNMSVKDFEEVAASVKGNLNFNPSKSVEAKISATDNDQKYLYVLVETGNGYHSIEEFDTTTKTEGEKTDDKDQKPVVDGKNEDTGLFDYDFGSFILLVLVIVLIVSCALIITQKIVDYKKRLY